MGLSQVIAAGAALSAFSGNSQHKRLMRLDFPFEDGPPAILLPNTLVAREEVSRGSALLSKYCRTKRASP
jgi:type VI secretion system secreted protein VgrG